MATEDLPISDGARKRGYTDEQIYHALDHAIATIPRRQGTLELLIMIGPSGKGVECIEVGIVRPGQASAKVLHVMECRDTRFLPQKPQRRKDRS